MHTRRAARLLLIAFLMLFPATPLLAQQLIVQTGDVRLTLTGRMQFQFNTTSVDLREPGADEPAASTFETRRVRMAASLLIDDWIRGMIEPDFALGRLQLRQAWLELGFDPAFNVRAGQWKKPFSLIQLTSSSQLPIIERNVRIRGLDADLEAAAPPGLLTQFRGTTLLGEEQELLEVLGYDSYDLGAAVRGRVGRFEYEAGVFNGTGGDSRDENDGKSLAARATYSVPAAIPLVLGLGVSRRDHLVGPAVGGETEHGTAWEADVELGEYRRPGPWLLAEYAAGSNLAGSDFRGAQAIASWYLPTGRDRIEGVAPVLRASWGDPDTDVADDAGLLLTPGFNLHFHGRNQLMLNWDWYLPQSDVFDTEHALRAQVQLYY